VFAEYLGIAVQTAMGKPLYLVVHDPANGPLGRGQPTPHELENADMEPARGTPVTRVKA
jgi:undecaprenyl-phosphate 4-deoxy-4-formamido-L-arabinose transferase